MIKNKLKPIIMALTTATACLAAGNVVAGGPSYKVAINEFFRAGNLTTTDEWEEIILLEDLTAAQLNTYFVGDSTGSTASKFSSYQFTDMVNIAPIFCAGTIITVGGDTGPATDIVYDPATNDWNLSLLTSGANITSTTGGGNLAGNDVVYIDTVDTGNTLTADGFAINWDGAPGTFGGNATFSLTGANRPGNNQGAFLNDVLANITNEAFWTSDTVIGGLTPGAVNGGNNSTSIAALQAAALGTVTIADTPTNNEGNAGNTAFTFTVTRTASCVAASVDYAVTGTGANPADAADFSGALPTGIVNFAAGVTTATITINVSGDTDVEMDENFLVTISNPTGVTLGATTTDTGTITNDDVLPVVATAVVDNNVSINGGADGQATASGSGGTPGYTFLWSNGQATATATGLIAGMYTVTVTDSTTMNNDTAMVTITEPTVLTSTTTSTDETFFGANDGTATVVAGGGVGPYTYLWMPGNFTTQTITGLMPGSYTVVVTDANGAISSPAAPSVIAAALPPAVIPTLNQYMIILLMLLVGLVAVKRVRVKV